MAGDIEDVFEAFFPESASAEAPAQAQGPAAPDLAGGPESPPAPQPASGAAFRPGTAEQWIVVPMEGRADPDRMAIVWYLGQWLTLAPNRLRCSLVARAEVGRETPWPRAHGSSGEAASRPRADDPLNRLECVPDAEADWCPRPGLATLVFDCVGALPIGGHTTLRDAPSDWLLLCGPDPSWARERALEIGRAQPRARIWATVFGVTPSEVAQSTLQRFAADVAAAGGPAVSVLDPLAVDPVLLFAAMNNHRPITAYRENSPTREAVAQLAAQLLDASRTRDAPDGQTSLREVLRRAEPALRPVATDVLIGSTRIDLIAVDDAGGVVAVFDARGDDLACFTRALGSLADLEGSLPTWWGTAATRALLVGPAFQPATRAAASRLGGGEISLREAPPRTPSDRETTAERE